MRHSDAPNTFACQDSSSCVYHMSNSAFSGLVGCCSGQHCGFESVCYNAAQVTATPSLTSGNIAFALFCTNSTSPSCGTYTWPGAALTDYVCDTTTFVSNIYTVATWGEPEDGTILWATQYITKIDDETMSMYSSLYDTSTSVSKPNRQATSTRSITAATTTAQPTASSSGSSGSSISSGTIAGSVVGSIACAGVIGAGVVFLLWKRRKSRQQDGLNDPAQVQYQSVPKDQSDHSEWGIQQAVEVEASDSVHKMAEAPGSTPHNASQEVSSNAFIAELPSPDDGKHH